jgi:hypothetical protein
MTETGRYIYAISRRIEPTALDATRGLDDGTLAVVEHRGLSAVVSDVDLAEFGEDGLRRNLEDLGWLERVARGHDHVVQAVAGLGPTAPLRLATICLDDAAVRTRLDEWHDGLTAALDRVEGRREWSVKAFAPVRAATQRPVATTTSGAGAAYLQRKRTETVDRQQAEQQALELAEFVHAQLSSRSVASRRLQPQDPKLSGYEGTMTLNGAYLVEVDDEAEFAAAAETLAGEHPGARLVIHGPWPPYSFATLEQT